MKHARINRSIAAYQQQQDELIDVIKKHGGWLTQDQFDREFACFHEEERVENGRKVIHPVEGRRFGMTYLMPDAVILGDFASGSWGQWLGLAQHMVRAGILTIRGEVPNVEYGIAAPESKKP